MRHLALALEVLVRRGAEQSHVAAHLVAVFREQGVPLGVPEGAVEVRVDRVVDFTPIHSIGAVGVGDGGGQAIRTALANDIDGGAALLARPEDTRRAVRPGRQESDVVVGEGRARGEPHEVAGGGVDDDERRQEVGVADVLIFDPGSELTPDAHLVG